MPWMTSKDKKKSNRGRRDGILSDHVETISASLINSKELIMPNYRGRVVVAPASKNDNLRNGSSNVESQSALKKTCVTEAISIGRASVMISGEEQDSILSVDNSKCIMCGRCQLSYPELFKMESQFATPARSKSEMIVNSPDAELGDTSRKSYEKVGGDLRQKIKKIFGRSLAIREVDAGSCNGCEVEITALNNAIYDIERFGIHFVASPRHADVLMVTGPASRNMEIALETTYKATPDPKIVIAVGACACSGGIFGDTYATTGGIDKVVPVDVYIPGCPPRPQALLYGLFLAVDRLDGLNRNTK
jgi:Ni,Fe-hydrogenase III small subunit/ferredoxin